ncbi:TonB-dependent receptor [Pseudolysobacter antarcticus]|uniref:TonB-dependent receptor n=1 Tax=Pseudolysobacter antarcticus TaxID=2511995 RepID=A0A411HFT5_9GAMM|nr:TonB-dependent receptor [Pseudolysobacter antarcticus]QBB69314.1 TonB-dependent receptor [Pseudolysobacter antarcticus]
METAFYYRERKRFPAILLLLLVMLAMAVAQVHATQSEPTQAGVTDVADASTNKLQPIDVVGHYDNAVGTSDAASQGVILGKLLQDIPLLRPGEVLESIPGLVVTQHSGDGKANQYFLRGYNLDHGTDFATSVDGVPVNMPTNGHGQGYSDLNFLIPELVDRIEYRKGPYFAQNGDFASAGSADIRYRNSLDRSILDLSIGDNGYRRILTAASIPLPFTAPAGNGSGPTLLAALELSENNGPWKLPEDIHKFNGLLRASDGNADLGWSLEALAYDAHWRSTDQVPLELIQSGALCRFCALDPTDGGRSARQILSGEWHTQDNDGYLRTSAYFEHYRLQLWSNFTYFEANPDMGDQFNQRDARNILGSKIANGWKHSLFGHESVTEIGAQVRHDVIHVSLLDTQARVPFATVTDNLVDETEAALYIQNTTVWTDWLRSLAGLRADAISLDLTSQSYAPNSGKVSDNRASPKLSLIFGPWRKTEFFINIGDGFHSNDARGAVSQFDPITQEPVIRTPALVGSFGKELGVRTEIVPGLQSSLALWSLNSASELLYAADSGGTEANGASKRYGVEWNNHMVINQWLLFDADLAWTRARYANNNDNGDSGDQIPNAVSKVASVGISAHDLGPWSGDLKFRYIGGYPLTQDGSLRAPSALVANLRVQRQLNDWAALSLDVLNLFDRKYYDIAYGQDYQISPTSPLVPNGITVHPGEPRELRLTLRLKL